MWQKITRSKKRRTFNIKNIIISTSGVILGVSLVWFFLLRGNVASAAWWNNTWKHRQSVAITNATTALTDYQTMVTMDTATLVTAGKMQSDCDDIRIVDQSGKQYSFWIEPTTCNTSATKIWAKVPSIPTTGGLFYIYYGNPTAGSVSKNPSEIFIQEIDNVGAAWLLDESSANTCTGGTNDSCDASGGDYDLAWGTNTTSTTGKISNGLTFDGTDDATANINDTFGSVSATKRWAVALWFKTSDTQGYLFDSGDSGNVGERVAVFTDGANNLSLYMSNDTNGTEYKYLNYSVTSTDNNWHHLVVTRDGDNSVKLYVDSNLISVNFTSTDVDMSSYSESWVDFTLGHRYVMNIYNYNGLIDEARVYTDALTATEVSALYGNGTNRHGYVTANYPGKELIRQYSANVTVGSPGNEETGPGPIAYWKFDEGTGTSVNDSSGSNYTGNLGTGSSAPTWKSSDSCVNESCLQFDGTDDSIDFGDTLDFTGNTEMTVSAWVKILEVPGARAHIISKYDAGTAGQWYLAIDGNSKVTFLRECGLYGETGVTPVALNTWNHVVGVYDGTNIQVYLNGILDKTAVDSCSISNTSVDVKIGAGDNGTGTEDEFKGFIDEVKVYPYARTADEIKQDYLFSGAEGSSAVLGASDQAFLTDGLVGYWKMDETTGTSGPSWTAADSSGSGKNGTGAGNAAVSSGKYNNGGSFDGNGDYLNMGDYTEHDLTFPFTVSAWINLSQLPSGKGSDSEIISKYGGSGTRQWTFSIGTDDTLYFWKSHNGTNGEYGVMTGHTFTSSDVNVWRHVVYTADSQGRASMYVDGALVENYAFSNQTIYTGASTQLRVGSRALNSNYFKGNIDEVRVYKKSLTSAQVKSLYQSAPGPVAYYPLDEGTGTSTVSDKSGNGNTLTMSDLTGNSWRPGKYGSSLYFRGDNADDELYGDSMLNNLPNGDFTTSFWFNWNVDGGMNWDVPIGKRGYSPGGWWIQYEATNRTIALLADFGTTDLNYVSASNIYSLNQWTYATVVYRSATKTAEFYINGAKVGYGSTTDAGVGTYQDDSSNTFRIGRDNEAGQRWTGQMDDIRIYNYARTPSQIIEDMNAGHPLGGSPVGSQLAYWRMDEGYGDYAYDSRGNSNAWLAAGDVCPGDTECPTWTNDGKFGKALSFDGGDLMEASAIGAYDNNGTDPYTATLWFKSDTNPTYNYALMGIVSNFGGNQDRFIQVTSTGVPRFYVYDGTERYATGTTDVIDNTWHHIAGIFDGSTIYIYVDGKLEGSTATTGSENHTNPYIRFSHQVTNYYDHTVGSIDEAKIYTAALTREQILLDMNQGRSMVLGATNTGVGGSTPSNSAGREYCVPGDATSCSAPIFELNLDENTGTTAYDTSTNGNDGSIENGAKWKQSSQCKSNSCTEFDGSDDYIGLSDDSVLNFSGGSFTAETWVKFKSMPSVVDRQFIILNKAADSGDSTSRGWQLRVSKYTDELSFRVWPSTGQPDVAEVVSDNTIELDRWYHVAAVYDGTADTASMYVNGTLQQSTASAITATDYATDLTLGAYTGGAGTHELHGYMDQVKIYNYARTSAQIAWDMNKGAPIAQYRFDECQGTTANDSSGNGNSGTITIGGSGEDTVGNCSTSSTAWGSGSSGKLNASIDFDGTDDYVQVSDNDTLDISDNADLSVSAWMKVSALANDYTIVSKKTSQASTDAGYMLFFNDPSDIIDFRVSDGTDQFIISSNTGQITSGAWVHVVGVYKDGDATNSTIYINGKAQKASTTGNVTNVNSLANAIALRIGTQGNGNSSLPGQIDDVRIYNYDLTAHQVKEIYSGGAVVFK